MAFDKVNLASSSPRRRELLSKITNRFNILKVDFTEPEEKDFDSAETYIRTCVESKVRQLIENYGVSKRGQLALVADTTVFLKGKLLGKPRNRLEAMRMLKTLSGKKHEVYTGYWVGPIDESVFKPRQIKWEISEVTFHKLRPAEIKNYVYSGEPMDKAGAYGFQGLGLKLIREVEGAYSNIMGLPVLKIRDELARWMFL